MIRPLIHDPVFLAKKSEPATNADLQIARDLLETLKAHAETCVGMAANMIGEQKQIIALNADGVYLLMLNPKILAKSRSYETEEGCLSLLGGPRKTLRYDRITVEYRDIAMKKHTAVYEGFPAEIIQHEVDHCNGILI